MTTHHFLSYTFFCLFPPSLSLFQPCLRALVYALLSFLSPKSAIPFTFSPFGPFYWVLAASGYWVFHLGTPVFPFILCGCWIWLFLCSFPRLDWVVQAYLTLTPACSQAHLSLSLSRCTSFPFLVIYRYIHFNVIFILAVSLPSRSSFLNSTFARMGAIQNRSS